MEWRVIPTFPRYEACRDGRIRNRATGRIMKQRYAKNGYLRLGLMSATGKQQTVLSHQMTAITFLGPRTPPRTDVAHWNRKRDDNRAENLRWATDKENHADRDRHGMTARGSRCGSAVLTEAEVAKMRQLLAVGATQAAVAEKFNTARSNVHYISTGKYWRHI